MSSYCKKIRTFHKDEQNSFQKQNADKVPKGRYIVMQGFNPAIEIVTEQSLSPEPRRDRRRQRTPLDYVVPSGLGFGCLIQFRGLKSPVWLCRPFRTLKTLPISDS